MGPGHSSCQSSGCVLLPAPPPPVTPPARIVIMPGLGWLGWAAAARRKCKIISIHLPIIIIITIITIHYSNSI